ncbi:cobalt-precorrin-6A reductase [Fuchsiella alkaliacetigena]|uniref:cobalt-precorrin-6A reductase n=1 Tax=Fuchsiella alkaliacetigena TaxID=957042 RepID=UPI00200A017F|nr:cobalt-precorrin-6A reductase [Fuchsiella alkaliacetigena]MCK8825522.1 cobalt-precorrin-6A reductase [Fuchsiella alkaliacetigena]
MIYVVAGTADSRRIIERLLAADYQVVASAVTEYGQQLLAELGEIEIVTDRLNQSAMQKLIKEHRVNILIDATHPFAQEVSKTAIAAAEQLGIAYLRFERAEIEIPASELVVKRSGFTEAIDYIKGTAGQVLLTIGSKNLADFVRGIPDFAERVMTRVLPTAGVLTKCEELGIPPSNIIAMQGPFSKELNKQLLIDYQLELLVTKASGKTGGLDTKLEAAQELGIPSLVVTRPQLDYPEVFADYQQLIERVEELLAEDR